MVITIGVEGTNNAGKSMIIDEVISQFELSNDKTISDKKIKFLKIHPCYDNLNAQIIFGNHAKWWRGIDDTLPATERDWQFMIRNVSWAFATLAGNMICCEQLPVYDADESTVYVVVFDRTVYSGMVYNVIKPLLPILLENEGMQQLVAGFTYTIMMTYDIFAKLSKVYYVDCKDPEKEEDAAYDYLIKNCIQDCPSGPWDIIMNTKEDIGDIKQYANYMREDIMELVKANLNEEKNPENSWARTL